MCFELCFVCDKPIEKIRIPIPRGRAPETPTASGIATIAYPNLTELQVINTHYKCQKLFDRQAKLSAQLLDVEWALFKLKN